MTAGELRERLTAFIAQQVGVADGTAQPRRGRRVRRSLMCCVLGALLTGCAARQPVAETPAEVLFSGTLQELAPHHPGDHFVYRVTGGAHDNRLQVEHISALENAGEFAVNVTEDGAAIGKMHLRDDGSAVTLLSEGFLQDGLMLVYAEPPVSIRVPLRSGSTRAASPVTLVRIADGKVLAHGRFEQTTTVRRVDAAADGVGLEVRTERLVQLPNRAMHLTVTTWVTPGIGEVRSEGGEGGQVIRRELVCATIAGRRVGNCDALMKPMEP